MSRPVAPAPTTGAPLSSERLRALAQRLIASALPGPHLVHLRGGASGLQLSVLALADLQPEALHPLDALVGFSAPVAWQALGVVAPGSAHHLAAAGGGSAASLASRHSTRVQVALLVARGGEQAGALATSGRIGAHPPAELADQPVEGLLSDALRRCLGLTTPAPVSAPSHWVTARWLDRLTLRAAAGHGSPPLRTRAQALAVHPLAAAAPGGVVTAASLQQASRVLDLAGWEGLRRVAAGTAPLSPAIGAAAESISPSVARWADAGSLARLLEAELPPLDFLLDAAGALLAPRVAAVVTDVAADTRAARR